MFRIGMILSCIFMTKTTLEETNIASNIIETGGPDNGNGNSNKDVFDQYRITCYTCVNVSDNLVCNQYAIDRPCKGDETFCHTLHIMDSKGTSVLVNKKCTTEKECQRNKVGCVGIDKQTMCISCCDENYCNEKVPINSSTAIFDDRITKMRMHAKNLFREQEKALTTSVREAGGSSTVTFTSKRLIFFMVAVVVLFSIT